MFHYVLYYIYQATGTRLGAVTQIISGLLTGITIAFIYGWLTTLLILLAVPVMMVSNTLQTKLVIGVGGNSKKAYEKSGSVSEILFQHYMFRIVHK